MSFLSPTILWGGLAAGIPIALHFFFRSRYRHVPWAAMKFLLTSIEQTSRRLKFQELLLLCLRVLLLVLLALALARPVSSVMRGSGQAEAIDAVFLFDDSYSMGAKDGATTRLGKAKTTALEILEKLPPHSTVQIVTCADRAQSLGPRSPSNLDQAKSIIGGLEITSLASDLSPGLLECIDALKRGPSSNKELYVFSDMQKLAFEKKSGEVVNLFQKLREQATITLVRCESGALKNVAVIGITPQSGVPRPGQRVDFGVLVQNTGTQEVTDVELSLMVDNNPAHLETKTIAVVPPGDTRVVTLSAMLEKPGLRVLTARVKNDDVPGDNRFDQVIPVRENVNVLVVDGGYQKDNRTPSSYFLQHALQPVKDTDRAKYYMQPRVVAPFVASPQHLQKQDVCFLVNVGVDELKGRANTLSSDFLDELASFVRRGKSLVIYAGDNVQNSTAAYNKVLGEKLGLLPLPLKKVHEFSFKTPQLIRRETFNLPAFLKFKEDKFYKGFGDVEVTKMIELEEMPKAPEGAPGDADKKAADAVVALRYTNGMPAVVTRKVDAGEVVFITTAADFDANDPARAWTDWPLRIKEFVPFVDVLMSHLLHGLTDKHNLVAGETLVWYPKEKEPRAYTLIHPGGKSVPLGVPEKNKEGKPVIVADDLPTAGNYRLLTSLPPSLASRAETPAKAEDPSTGLPIAVIPDLRESEGLESLSDDDIDGKLQFTPIHLSPGAGAIKDTGLESLNREWTMWWILALLALVGVEGLFAFWCGRSW